MINRSSRLADFSKNTPPPAPNTTTNTINPRARNSCCLSHACTPCFSPENSDARLQRLITGNPYRQECQGTHEQREHQSFGNKPETKTKTKTKTYKGNLNAKHTINTALKTTSAPIPPNCFNRSVATNIANTMSYFGHVTEIKKRPATTTIKSVCGSTMDKLHHQSVPSIRHFETLRGRGCSLRELFSKTAAHIIRT